MSTDKDDPFRLRDPGSLRLAEPYPMNHHQLFPAGYNPGSLQVAEVKITMNDEKKVEDLSPSKYHRTITNVDGQTLDRVDVYSVLDGFDVTCPACAHAIKKLLVAGKRGHGSVERDLIGALQAVRRALQLHGVKE